MKPFQTILFWNVKRRFVAVLAALAGEILLQAAEGPAALTVTEIASRIMQNAQAVPGFIAYTNRIPGSKATYVMLPIPAGEFFMGSAAGERYAKADEQPAHRVKLAAFWMSRCEVTWDEYDAFIADDIEWRQASPPPAGGKVDHAVVDAVTHPSLPYVDMSFGMGKHGYPAVAMTQHAANKYCQWLSAKTGHFHRLPTEAEWEYAARAGTSNAWFFGDDETRLADYAWYEANSDFQYRKVGTKPPNPWGLHDMLGNVSEWVLDQYDEDYYRRCVELRIIVAPWNKATKQYPHTVRGGSWRDGASDVRAAARARSTADWKSADPQLPKSRFWMRSCDFVGFRTVRPLAIPTAEEMNHHWNSGVERE